LEARPRATRPRSPVALASKPTAATLDRPRLIASLSAARPNGVLHRRFSRGARPARLGGLLDSKAQPGLETRQSGRSSSYGLACSPAPPAKGLDLLLAAYPHAPAHAWSAPATSMACSASTPPLPAPGRPITPLSPPAASVLYGRRVSSRPPIRPPANPSSCMSDSPPPSGAACSCRFHAAAALPRTMACASPAAARPALLAAVLPCCAQLSSL